MLWNWQLSNWPHFTYDSSKISTSEKKFLQGAGGVFAVLRHLRDAEKKQFIVEMLCTEGLKSSEIEGEILERQSLQSSIQCHFGIVVKDKRSPLKERGMGDLMWKIYDTYDQVLSHEMLYEWHTTLMHHDSKMSDIGKYRSHEDPMQIVSGRYDKQRVYFEAPPSAIIYKEMNAFIEWYNESREGSAILERAAVAHVYFESIHPFEDGNGRIGRALVEKALSQSLEQPTLIAVSSMIAKKKTEYYAALAACNRTLDIESWMIFFATIIVQAQEESLTLINFLIAKATLMDKLRGKINNRQEKVLLRMFAEGVEGFLGGLSAENYIAITKTSRATATRDLAALVEMGALHKSGELRHTRYRLIVD